METAMIQETEFERTQTTDPREAKLRDIIERGKASLHKALEEIQHEFSIREDMAVRHQCSTKQTIEQFSVVFKAADVMTTKPLP